MVASAGNRSGSRAPVLAKYDVLDELGHGGMATVYRAHDKRLSRDVAIKVLHPHLRESREIAHRFSVEAKAVAKLRHPNIVEVFDVSSEEETEQYLVVELVRGPTLRKLLQDRGAMPPEIAASIVMELLSGIAHAHASGVVHRDVKPENVLIEHRARGLTGSGGPVSDPLAKFTTPIPTSPSGSSASSTPPTSGDRKTPSPHDGERAQVKLTDFGIAKLLDAQGVTSTGQVLGSPAHMAPEQIEGGDVDGRADVFGLGVLLYECMVGHLPFLGNNPAQVLRRVLDGVYAPAERERSIVGKVWSQILDKALARKAEARFADAQTMRDVIASELARLSMGAPRIEIEAWLDDPEGWTKEHDKRLIDRLCQLGAASRKKSDSIAAAADYNRALAYAPNDPQLLRVVSSMQRSEARARLVRRVAPLVLGAAVLGPGAYFVAKAFKSSPLITTTVPGSSSDPSAKIAPAASSLAVTSARPTGSEAPTTSISTRVVAVPSVVPASAKPVVTRVITFGTVSPSFGTRMQIDGQPATDPDTHKSFTLDDKPHTLTFSCADDLCVAKTVQIPPGDKDETLAVELAIAPAKIIVEGDPSHSYGIEEMPNVTIAAGQETEIPMNRGRKLVTVFDRIDPTKKQAVNLKAGGKPETVSFKKQ
jgi:eukaryotic-like serine/threonine-protein kinase